jgi:hypothetical protein
MIFSSPVKIFSVSAEVFSVAMILYLRSHCCRILTVLPVRASVYRVCSKSCCDMYEKLVLQSTKVFMYHVKVRSQPVLVYRA